MAKKEFSTVAKSILEGIEDATAFFEGKESKAFIVAIDIPDVDAAEVRKKTGLSQDSFSKLIGVSPSTLRNWEQDRRQLKGPAKTLLAIVNERPTIVQELLGNVVTKKKPKKKKMAAAE